MIFKTLNEGKSVQVRYQIQLPRIKCQLFNSSEKL